MNNNTTSIVEATRRVVTYCNSYDTLYPVGLTVDRTNRKAYTGRGDLYELTRNAAANMLRDFRKQSRRAFVQFARIGTIDVGVWNVPVDGWVFGNPQWRRESDRRDWMDRKSGKSVPSNARI